MDVTDPPPVERAKLELTERRLFRLERELEMARFRRAERQDELAITLVIVQAAAALAGLLYVADRLGWLTSGLLEQGGTINIACAVIISFTLLASAIAGMVRANSGSARLARLAKQPQPAE
jgi:hypothetical protein